MNGKRVNGSSNTSDAAAEGAIALAWEHYERGRARRAEAVCRRLLARWPDRSDAHHLLGLIVHDAGQHDRARWHLDRAIELQPGVAEYHVSLGQHLREVGRLDESVTSLRQALELGPERSEAHRQLGKALAAAYRFEPALECYRRALELGPLDFRIRPDLIVALQKLGPLREVLASRPDYVPLVVGDGSVLPDIAFQFLASGHLAEAAQVVRLALEYHPDRLELAELAQ